MGKKKKVNKRVKKLEKKFYKNNKYVSREEFLISKLSRPMKEYYRKLSEERKKSLISYILKQEDYESHSSLERISTNEEEITYEMKSCKTIAKVIGELKKTRKKYKKAKKKQRNVLRGSKGILYLLNPEAYDQTLLSKKEYRKQLKKMAEKELKDVPIELDCTLKNFHKQLMSNDSVNEDVMNSFWNKYGY